MKALRALVGLLLLVPALVWAWARRLPPEKRILVWGPTPLLNYRYWSAAFREAGTSSVTLMKNHYGSINQRSDFDLYFEDLVPRMVPGPLRPAVAPFAALSFVLRRAKVLHMPFSGGPLGGTLLWRLEAHLYRTFGIGTVIIPHGGDVYRYSRIEDPVARHGLMLSFPQDARAEARIAARVDYWTLHASCIVMGFTLEGVARWDVPVGNMIAVDVHRWPRGPGSDTNGSDPTHPVVVLHTPNHRGAKGTEFLIAAIEQLRQEGLAVELHLLEGVTNGQVLRAMQVADIYADQFVLPGYGLAAVEAMASGLPVVGNVHDGPAERLFRRYSYLGHCPIVGSTPDTLVADLRRLIMEPKMRRQIAHRSRVYAETFHSYTTARHLFGNIHRKIVEGAAVDLMNLFHPQLGTYPAAAPVVVPEPADTAQRPRDAASPLPEISIGTGGAR